MLNKIGSVIYDIIKRDNMTLTFREIENTTWTREYKDSVHEMKRKTLWR